MLIEARNAVATACEFLEKVYLRVTALRSIGVAVNRHKAKARICGPLVFVLAPAQYLIVQPYALEVAAVTALPFRASASAAAT